jgi:cytochrome c-type biogenesis protein CcmH
MKPASRGFGFFLLLCATWGALVATASAEEASPTAENPALEIRLREMANELRCLVCQNQSLADSDAPLAVDLRREIRTMMEEGRDDASIIQYLVDRYGDFIRFRPPLKATTLLLWFGPPILIALAGSAWVFALRRRQRVPATPLSNDERRRLEQVLDDSTD